MRVLLLEQGQVLETDQRRGSIGGMLTDPQDLPQQQNGSGKRRKGLVEAADLLAHPAAFDLEQGGSVALPREQNGCHHWEKDGDVGGAPCQGLDPGLGSGSVIRPRKSLGLVMFKSLRRRKW